MPNGRTLADPHLPYKLEWLAALRDDGRRLAGRRPGRADRARRRLEHRPAGRRRVGHERLRRTPRTSPSPSAPRSGRSSRPGTPTSSGRYAPGPGRLHLLGLHAAALPPPRGHADRLRPRLPRAGRPGDRCADRPRGAQGQGRQRPRPGDRRPGRPRPRTDETADIRAESRRYRRPTAARSLASRARPAAAVGDQAPRRRRRPAGPGRACPPPS